MEPEYSAVMPHLAGLGLAVTLLVASAALAPGRACAQGAHTVRAGQSLSEIARRHGIRIRDLAAANRMEPGDPIRVGQVLVVPPRGVVFVRAGQTLSHIARENGVGIEALAHANHMRTTSTIRAGQRLVLPGFSETRSADTEREDWGEPSQAGVVRLRTRTEHIAVHLRDERGHVPGDGLLELARAMQRGDDAVAAARAPDRDTILHDYAETWRADLVSAIDPFELAPRGEEDEPDDEIDEPDGSSDARSSMVEDVCRRASRESPDCAVRTPSPRLALLLAAISDHFGGREIWIISGFREVGGRTRETSRHVRGQATDVRVDGVSKRALWDYCLSLRATGCGLYPNSTFVHVDVREAEAQWVDWSGPGRRARYGTLHGPSRGRRHAHPRIGRHVTRPDDLPLEATVAGSDDETVSRGAAREGIPTS